MSKWFGRKRRLGRTFAAMPADADLWPNSGTSLPDSGHEASKLPRPMQKLGRQVASNAEQSSRWWRTPSEWAVAYSFTRVAVHQRPSVWGRRFINQHRSASIGRESNHIHRSRYLILLLMSTLMTASYCCCVQMDDQLVNDVRSSSKPAANHYYNPPLSINRDPIKVLNAAATTTINGQQVDRSVPPRPLMSGSLEGLSSNSSEPTVTLGTKIDIVSKKPPPPMPSVGMSKIVHLPVSTPNYATNSTKVAGAKVVAPLNNQQVGSAVGLIGNDHHLDQLAAQSTQLAPSTLSRQLTLTAAASGDSLEPLVVSASKKKKKMMKKKKKMEKKHKEWKKGKKHKKKKYESKKKKGGSSKKKKGKKEKKKWGMEKKGHKKKGNFKKKKWGKKKKMKKGSKKGKKGHKMLKDKGHKKKGFKKVYHKEEWGKKKKWHDIKREKKWNTKQKKWKKKWHQEKGKKYKGKHMKKYEKKNKHGKKYKKEKKSKWKKHKGEKFKKGHKKKKEEYSKKKEGGKKKKMKKEMKKMKKKKG